MKKFLGLGRGLESLIPKHNGVKVTPKQQDSIFYIEVNKIRPNSSQPRSEFDSKKRRVFFADGSLPILGNRCAYGRQARRSVATLMRGHRLWHWTHSH